MHHRARLDSGSVIEWGGVWFMGAAYRAAAFNAWNALINSAWFGQASLIASFTRRTPSVTSASIFISFSRIVFARALASSVP